MSEPRTITASFSVIPNYSVTTVSIPAHGGTTSGSGSYTAGTTVIIASTPAGGWEFTEWIEDGEPVSPNAEFEFQIEASRAFTAVFSLVAPASLTTDRIAAALLGAVTLNTAERDYLDSIGNNTGRFDPGDFLACLDRQ